MWSTELSVKDLDYRSRLWKMIQTSHESKAIEKLYWSGKVADEIMDSLRKFEASNIGLLEKSLMMRVLKRVRWCKSAKPNSLIMWIPVAEVVDEWCSWKKLEYEGSWEETLKNDQNFGIMQGEMYLKKIQFVLVVGRWKNTNNIHTFEYSLGIIKEEWAPIKRVQNMQTGWCLPYKK